MQCVTFFIFGNICLNYYTRSSRARHGGPAGVAGHSNVAHSSHLYPTSTPGWHVKTRVCPPLVAPISPSPRSVPRSFSTETSLLVPSHDAPLMLEPWRVAHSSSHSPTRPHADPSVPTRPVRRTHWNPTTRYLPALRKCPCGAKNLHHNRQKLLA